MQPSDYLVPLPEIDSALQKKIYDSLAIGAKVRLTDKLLPSVVCIDLVNTQKRVCCMNLSEDCTVMALGLSDSHVKVFFFEKQNDDLTVEDLYKFDAEKM